MLEEATLDVLAHAAEIGLPETAEVPASVYDPLLRPFIKQNVRRAIAGASAATTSTRGDHVLRLAFLREHPAAPRGLDPNDARAIAEAFEALAKPFLPERPPPDPAAVHGGAYRVAAPDRRVDPLLAGLGRAKRKPWPVTFSAIGLAVVSVLVVIGVLLAPYVLPSPMQRFAKTPFGKALGEPLTDAVASAGAGRDPARRDEARAKVLTKDVEKQIGPAAFGDLTGLLAALPDASRSDDESTDAALGPAQGHVNAVNAHLATGQVPALLHLYASGQVGRRSVWVTSYFVEERSEIDIGGRPLRIARGRRLDELNLLESTLYKGEHEDWAIVSLARIDEQLVQWLLTPLAKGAPMGPEEWLDTDETPPAELARTASRLVTSELFAHARLEASAADTLRSAIARRNDAMVSLNKVGFDVEATSRIWLTPGLVRGLERMSGTRFERKLADEVLRIDRRMKVYAKPVAPVIAELARLQEEVFAGRLHEQARQEGEIRRAEAIAASMLASLSRPQPCPRLALWLDVRLAFDRRGSWDERAAATRVLEALFGELGLDPNGARELRAKAALEAPPEQVRDAAGRAYARLFRGPPPALSRKAL